jgi:hypothetical protein
MPKSEEGCESRSRAYSPVNGAGAILTVIY